MSMLPCSDKTGFLEACPILSDIPPEAVLAAMGTVLDEPLTLPPNVTFMTAGQVDPGLCLVVDGTVELFACDNEHTEKIVDFARRGDALAAETLFTHRPLQYSARSLTLATVLFLPQVLISEWAARFPEFSRRLMELVSQRIDYLFKDMLTLRSKRAAARVICYLVCHFDRAPRTPDNTHLLVVDLPHNKIASRLGITDSHLSRVFRELQEEGLIVEQGNGYFIPDVPALSKYVCPCGCAF